MNMEIHARLHGADSFIESKTGIKQSISPLQLPLQPDTFVAEKNNDLFDLHGVFADCLPDSWGQKVQDVGFDKIGIGAPTAIERLAFVGKSGIGALRFEPAQSFAKANEIVTLAGLRKAALSVIKGDLGEVADELLHCGGSAGGAKPKFLVDLQMKKNSIEVRYAKGRYSNRFVPEELAKESGVQGRHIKIVSQRIQENLKRVV